MLRQEGLRVPYRARKKRLTGIGTNIGAISPTRPNVVWAADFQFDQTGDGRQLKPLNIIKKTPAKPWPWTWPATSTPTTFVRHPGPHRRRTPLPRVSPLRLRALVSHAIANWCRFNATLTVFIDPGSPWQSAWCESFNAHARDELLNIERFDTLLEAQNRHRRLAHRPQQQPAPQRPRLAPRNQYAQTWKDRQPQPAPL